MKLIIFLIIIAIIYYLTISIKVVHLETLPNDQQKELETRKRVREMLVSNHVKEHFEPCPNVQKSVKKDCDYERDFYDLDPIGLEGLPGHSDLVELIRSEYGDGAYAFNRPNLPSVSRYPTNSDTNYEQYVHGHVSGWNSIFRKYYNLDKKLIKIHNIKLIYIIETKDEFLVKANVELRYTNRLNPINKSDFMKIYLQLTYYAQNIMNDDILNNEDAQAKLQLVEMNELDKTEYDKIIREDNRPFLTMSEQNKYVNYKNNLHKFENDN